MALNQIIIIFFLSLNLNYIYTYDLARTSKELLFSEKTQKKFKICKISKVSEKFSFKDISMKFWLSKFFGKPFSKKLFTIRLGHFLAQVPLRALRGPSHHMRDLQIDQECPLMMPAVLIIDHRKDLAPGMGSRSERIGKSAI